MLPLDGGLSLLHLQSGFSAHQLLRWCLHLLHTVRQTSCLPKQLCCIAKLATNQNDHLHLCLLSHLKCCVDAGGQGGLQQAEEEVVGDLSQQIA